MNGSLVWTTNRVTRASANHALQKVAIPSRNASPNLSSVPSNRLPDVFGKNYNDIGMAVVDLIPPPFPSTAFILAAGPAMRFSHSVKGTTSKSSRLTPSKPEHRTYVICDNWPSRDS